MWTMLKRLGNTRKKKYLDKTDKGKWYTIKWDNSDKIVFAPFWKGVYSKRKNLLPTESKFFPFRVDHFGLQKCKQEVLEDGLFC